ncbi:MAG: hypothetical protein ACREVL_06590, partial [Solimonas sp.]
MPYNQDWRDYTYPISPSEGAWYTAFRGGGSDSWSNFAKNTVDPGRVFLGGPQPDSDTYAADTRAALLRSQWQDWKTRYAPLEDTLLNAYRNPNLRTQAQERGADLFQRSVDAADAAADRRLAGYG